MIFKLIGMTVFEVVKRVVGLVAYPIAYHFSKDYPRKKNFWWYWMDDTICEDSLARVGKPLNYCSYPGKEEPLKGLAKSEFMKSYNWGALRNNAINLRDTLALGPEIEVVKHIGGDKNYYEVRKFAKGNYPYFQWWFGEHFRIQAGWLSGNGTFQVQANNK